MPSDRKDTAKLQTLILLSCCTLTPAVANDDFSGDSLDLSDSFEADYSFLLEEPVPEVLSTTKLRQPKSRVPGSTTVIRGSLIRDLGILNLAEVFRLVPGMTVGHVGSNSPVTSYHGTVAYEQRRLQVQIDGRTAYQPNLSNVDWNTMPVAIENIERIEVSRGPNAAAYGINAFLGTINIITKSPADTEGVNLHSSYGGLGHKQLFGSTGNTGDDYDWRLSYERRGSDGFDYRFDDNDNKVSFHDGYALNFFSYDAIATLNNRNAVEVRAGVTDGTDEDDRRRIGEEFGALNDPDVDVRDYYLQATWRYTQSENHFLHLMTSYQDYDRTQAWRTCPQGLGVDFCADVNQNLNESRLELELQDTLIITPDFRIVSGLGYREDRFESDTFFNGKGANYQSRVFGNFEYTPVNWVTFNAGANWETTTTVDETFLSPRVAANFHLTDNQTLRFVYSEAVRTPDAFEQEADWGYRVTNLSPDAFAFLEEQRVGPSVQGSGDLTEEQITSREISYFGQFRLGNGLLSTEVKYFNDDLRDVIAGVLNVEEWTIGNNVALDQQGVELEASLEYPDTQLRLTYAYLDQDGRYTGPPTPEETHRFIRLESRLSAKHSGSFVWIQDYAWDLSSATAFYYVEEFARGPFKRADLRVAKAVYTPRLSYDVAVIFQHYFHDTPPVSRENNIEDPNQVFIEAGLRF
ncbi:TonB-dependent receptor plug domain-containing protein [Marinobacter zhejiangensis]|uniref:Iron complex outermembrane recepter protein n=1 Tax=Marinobacter zhejiangensis TaxID=488535 RepID=A0A1I4PEU9_9GAMM|nr:TonB-dependent receptor [Marinobacter zhejiangensis]SFM26046.1 iron complex outermembrane recepter protein [Marinobacter zhejiangensis]